MRLVAFRKRLGKSTICEEFGKNEYESYILIDFAKKDKEIERYFETHLNDLDTFFMLLQTHFGKKLTQRKSLIIFDEVQIFPQARAAIKYLVADSMISNECFLCNDPNVGLSLNETRSYVKCYLGDTGLLVSHAFDENELLEDEVYKQILAGKLEINEGMLYENAIAQMLVANGHKLYFYTHYNAEKHRNDMEIDFIISNNSKLKYKMYPIEVKSGKQYKTTSVLWHFRKAFLH